MAEAHPDDLTPYQGRWIARLGGRIIGQGGTPEQALQAAKAAYHKDTPQIEYVPTQKPLTFTERLAQVSAVLPSNIPVYLVGGAVRDALLERVTHDLDFVLPGQAIQVGRRVARALRAAFYPLDQERDTARVILVAEDGTRQTLDFALQRGPDLESDLRGRDFTINAMAVDVRNPGRLLDPLGGAADLRAKILRACSPSAFIEDPLRILRGVRLAAALEFRIEAETLKMMRQAVDRLPYVSAERIRDELFRILDGPQPWSALRALEMIGGLKYVLPELSALKGLSQPPPHIFDAWSHTLNAVQRLDGLLKVLALQYDPDSAASLMMGLVSLRLGRFRQQIHTHLSGSISGGRSLRSLLLLATLYHDAGKPQAYQLDERGRVRFFEHDRIGEGLIEARAEALRLSKDEQKRLRTIVRHHMRPILLAQRGQLPSRRAVYRFFRDTGEAGVDVCLLSLADILATYGHTLPQEVWKHYLDVVRTLLEAYWEYPEQSVSPPALLNGDDLMTAFDLQPGERLGELLAAIREAQASGEISDRESALRFAQNWLRQHQG